MQQIVSAEGYTERIDPRDFNKIVQIAKRLNTTPQKIILMMGDDGCFVKDLEDRLRTERGHTPSKDDGLSLILL